MVERSERRGVEVPGFEQRPDDLASDARARPPRPQELATRALRKLASGAQDVEVRAAAAVVAEAVGAEDELGVLERADRVAHRARRDAAALGQRLDRRPCFPRRIGRDRRARGGPASACRGRAAATPRSSRRGSTPAPPRGPALRALSRDRRRPLARQGARVGARVHNFVHNRRFLALLSQRQRNHNPRVGGSSPSSGI